MSATKGRLADFSVESLRAELKSRDEQAQTLEREKRKQQGEIYLLHLETLLQLIPNHDSAHCSDEKRCEERCDRCKLLYAKEFNYWDEDQQITLTVMPREPVENVRAK